MPPRYLRVAASTLPDLSIPEVTPLFQARLAALPTFCPIALVMSYIPNDPD